MRFALALSVLLFAASGCSGALWGNLAVLGVTVGIFVATLGLGRVASAAASRSGRSPTASTSSSRR